MNKKLELFNISDNESDQKRNQICQYLCFGWSTEDLTNESMWANGAYTEEDVFDAVKYLNSLPNEDIENYVEEIKTILNKGDVGIK